ncbi:MAG: biotin synthase BioB [Nitrospinota bacterium]|nr:biotin synthase BioB [Nitrospinota bacterium]
MSRKLIESCRESALRNEKISEQDALELITLPREHIMDLIAAADAVRRKHKGNRISLCSIVNARSGRCGEDCAFCPQSVFSKSESPEYALMGADEIVSAAEKAIGDGAHKFGIVTSGKGPEKNNGDFEKIIASIRSMKQNVGIHRCASLGVIDSEQAVALKEAGLDEFHHNLETARSFYPKICSTRDYDENVATIAAAKSAGLRVCCGGILGMGETPVQRIELASELRELGVDSIPLNFLNPVEGTKLEKSERLKPLEVLQIIAVFRLFLPDRDIKVAGGREVNLRDLQSWMFFAGANSTMVGNYLTTTGRNAEDDVRMVEDLGLEVVGRG